MAVAWLITLPAAGIVGALTFWVPTASPAVSSALAGDDRDLRDPGGLSFYMFWRAQQQKVDHSNVNADWDTTTNSVVPAEVRRASGAARQDKPKEPIA